MKKCIALALATAGMIPVLAAAATDIGVSIGVREPGFFGRIAIGNLPPLPPPVVYAPPVIPAPPHIVVVPPPWAVYVPAGRRQDWRRTCANYHACGRPVVFVPESPVRGRYERPGPRGHGGGGQG